MGRKVHPVGFRLNIIKDWQSRWYGDRDYTELVHEDVRIRQLVTKRLAQAGLSRVEIQRSANQLEVTLYTAKPGVVIGKGGQAVDLLRRDLETMTGKKAKLNIEEVKQPELDARLMADSIAEQISRRVSYRRALKQSVLRAMRAGAKGVRVRISGRLGGAEMARSVWEMEGRVPLHTIRADIDYAQVHAHTTYGRIGVKVWLYKGDVIEQKGDRLLQMDRPAATAAPRPDRPARPERGDRGDRPDRGGRAGDGRRFDGDRGGDRGPRAPRGDRPGFQGQGQGQARAPQAHQGPAPAAPQAQAPAPAPAPATETPNPETSGTE